VEITLQCKEFIMKNKRFLTGMLIMALVFGMTVVGCDDGGDGGDKKEGEVPSGGGGSTFTMTGIPATYNGKYAALFSEELICGAQSMSAAGNGTLVAIAHGKVNLPMWTLNGNNVVKYTGSGTYECSFEIYKSAAYNLDAEPEVVLYFTVTFSNGSAAESYNNGKAGWKSGDDFEGTWVGSVEGMPLTVVAANESWTASINGVGAYKGTYITDGYDVTITFTHVNTALPSGTTWTPYGSLTDAQKEAFNVPREQDVPGTINGNQWEMAEGVIFTKQ
jgi:hypothetical protein